MLKGFNFYIRAEKFSLDFLKWVGSTFSFASNTSILKCVGLWIKLD